MPDSDTPTPNEDEDAETIEPERPEADTEPVEAAKPEAVESKPASAGPETDTRALPALGGEVRPPADEPVDREADTRPMEAVTFQEDTKPMVAAESPRPVKALDASSIILGLAILAVAARMANQPFAQLPVFVGPHESLSRRIRPVSDEPGGEFRLAGGTAVSLAWADDNKMLAVGRNDGQIEVWDVPKGVPKFVLSDEGEVFALAFGTRETRGTSDEPERKDCLFSLHGRFGRRGYESCHLSIWGLTDGKRMDRYDSPFDFVSAAAFGPGGRTLGLTSVERIALCSLVRLQLVRRNVSFFYPASLAVGGDSGRDVLIGEQSGSVLLLGSHEDISQRKLFHGATVRTAVALADHGRMAAAGFSAEFRDGRQTPRPVKLWPDWLQWDETRDLAGAPGDVLGLRFAGNGALLGFCVLREEVDGKTVRRPSLVGWTLETGREMGVQTLEPDVLLCEFSPDGTWAALAKAGGIIALRKVRLE